MDIEQLLDDFCDLYLSVTDIQTLKDLDKVINGLLRLRGKL